ncbi:polyphosphate polymerase domain-containing protein [Nonomuraea sp. GTA35]|uniref:polyphosphate polymerase domain-containing protein n=1 Tax=Nonomuraea sp. GTA35 TaxID=1676746 RepID=UPI0035C0DDA3
MAEPYADALLAGVAATMPAVGLEEVPELMSRVDCKYIVTASTMARLAAELGDRFLALRIEGRRQFRYTSTYFDTPGLLTYHQHRQDRRRRFKLRTRTYLDGGGQWLELKLSGARGSTDKHRIPYDGVPSHTLTNQALEFVHDTLLSELRLIAPETLEPVLATDYKRVTLIDRSGTARLTCDTGLVCRDGQRSSPARGDLVLLESKSVDGKALIDKVLRGLGVRPVTVSKYCLAVAALRELPANRWHPVLQRYLVHRPGPRRPASRGHSSGQSAGPSSRSSHAASAGSWSGPSAES